MHTIKRNAPGTARASAANDTLDTRTLTESGITLPPALARIRQSVLEHKQRVPRHLTEDPADQRVGDTETNLSFACGEDGGRTRYLGTLSPGCRACKQGEWECLFVTTRCNLACPFCLRSKHLNDPPGGDLVDQVDFQQLTTRFQQRPPKGVSFTGGEPLLITDKILPLIALCRDLCPTAWLWLYTNGLQADPKTCERLGEAGIDELRFNLAATNYDHPVVRENLRRAAGKIRGLTVEIPLIPSDLDRVIDLLPEWVHCGVTRLNLHELVYDQNAASGALPGPRVHTHMRDGYPCAFDPESRPGIARIMTEVHRTGLPLSVNDCSLRSKEVQMTGRRRRLSEQSLHPSERLVSPDMAERYCRFDSCAVREFFPKEHLDHQTRLLATGQHIARLKRILPMAPGMTGQWIDLDVLASEAIS